MDWLRRNWPDLLIGVALVAVIAGIIATLISGGSFFPFGQGGGGTTTPQPSTPITSPSTPGTTQPSVTQPGSPTGATAGQPGVTTPTPAGSEQTGSGSEQTGAAGTEAPPASPSSEGIAVLPPSGSGATGSTPATQPGTAGTSGTSGGTTEGATGATGTAGTTGGVTALPPSGATPSTTAPAAGTQPSTTAPSATTPSTTPSTTASTATPVAASADADEASYRVSVGAFGNADNAQRLAQQFQGAGYPVLLGTQGNLTIVLLGPYATDAEARRVAGQVDGSFGVVDPTVYRYEPDDAVASAPATTPAAPATATPAAPAASTTTPAAPPAPTASATGRYLQVGAYANRESSLPQRERLEGIGFTVTEVQEGELLKLLVGPYQGAALSDAQSRLAAEGIENFARGL